MIIAALFLTIPVFFYYDEKFIPPNDFYCKEFVSE
jgi:hypothetical protein